MTVLSLVFSTLYQSNAQVGKNDIVEESEATSCAVINDEEVKISSRLVELFFGKKEAGDDTVLLMPGGGIFGAKIKQSYVSVQSPGDIAE